MPLKSFPCRYTESTAIVCSSGSIKVRAAITDISCCRRIYSRYQSADGNNQARRPGCFPAAIPPNRLSHANSSTFFMSPLIEPKSTRRHPSRPCVTASPPICSIRKSIYASSRCCWGTPRSTPPPSIQEPPPAVSARSETQSTGSRRAQALL